VLERFQHPAGVTGVSFALGTWGKGGQDRLLATACADMGVRVFALRGTGAGASYEGYAKLFDLRGHRGKTFSVRWSPLLHGRLASSSDDGTVRVWDLNAPNSHVTLSGHVDKTRVLAWHHEALPLLRRARPPARPPRAAAPRLSAAPRWQVPFLLLSGSWDACIRVWDIRGEGECIRVVGTRPSCAQHALRAAARRLPGRDASRREQVMDHHADVYGLASHPARPFFFVSSSRDQSLRFWDASPARAPAPRLGREN
jgi:WD40 repeat protein